MNTYFPPKKLFLWYEWNQIKTTKARPCRMMEEKNNGVKMWFNYFCFTNIQPPWKEKDKCKMCLKVDNIIKLPTLKIFFHFYNLSMRRLFWMKTIIKHIWSSVYKNLVYASKGINLSLKILPIF